MHFGFICVPNLTLQPLVWLLSDVGSLLASFLLRRSLNLFPVYVYFITREASGQNYMWWQQSCLFEHAALPIKWKEGMGGGNLILKAKVVGGEYLALLTSLLTTSCSRHFSPFFSSDAQRVLGLEKVSGGGAFMGSYAMRRFSTTSPSIHFMINCQFLPLFNWGSLTSKNRIAAVAFALSLSSG